MTSWLGGHDDEATLLAVRTGLADQLAQLRGDTAQECPGRTAALVEARIGQMITGEGSMAGFGPLDDAEETVVAVAEQFALDVHGIDDALMARLGEHYTPAEQVAIMFRMAFADGFTKLRRVLDVPSASADATHDATHDATDKNGEGA
jgi:hypothetical protein